MKIVYIAGRYRAETINEMHDNIEAARKVAVKWWQNGFACITPHMNSAFMDGATDDSVFLEGGLKILSRCDIIVMMKGWEGSEGARNEYERAKELGLKVIFE
ncbi:MAG TPA: DUF4406 domain-containing protein [bacterium]|nr:DUF4406 domain-containing protein [bacterium]